MLTRTLIGTTTAAMIAIGSLAATTSTASATTYGFSFNGPGFFFSFRPRPHKVCKPVYRKVHWWKHGRRHTRFVKVGVRCHWVHGRGHHRRHHHRRYH